MVDDGGGVSLPETTQGSRSPLDVTLVRRAHAGPAAARNTGAAHAKGAVLVFLDDDCMPAPGWLRAFAPHFVDEADRVVGGRTINALTGNLYSSASQSLIDYLYAYFNPHDGSARFFASNNVAVAKAGFQAAGGFDPSFPLAAAEDRDFCDRWVGRGGQLACAPEALVYHAHELTALGFWRQHFNYGRGACRFHRARSARGDDRIRVAPMAFYLNLLRFPLTEGRGLRAGWLSILMGVSQVANAAGFFWEWPHASRSRRS